MASGDDAASFLHDYASELSDLKFNSKPAINTLTMLANERKELASSIAATVVQHIGKVRGYCVSCLQPQI